MGRLVVMNLDECHELLRSQVVGRIAFVTAAGPDVVPVNFALVDGSLHVRTPRDGYVARWASGRTVSFEVDDVDHESWTGWSVVVTGRAQLIAASSGTTLPRARSWTGDSGRDLLVIACETVTGRRLHHGPG